MCSIFNGVRRDILNIAAARIHLMQASRRKIPEESADDEVLKFDVPEGKTKDSVTRLGRIIFIFCEAF